MSLIPRQEMTNVACAEGTTPPVKLWRGPSTTLSMVSPGTALLINRSVGHELCQQYKHDSALGLSNPLHYIVHAGHRHAFQPHLCSFYDFREYFMTAMSAFLLMLDPK